jgi:hypothetical protein
VTVIGPVVAPEGTLVTIWVDVQLVTTATAPLKATVLLAGVVLKFVPVMVTVVPADALIRENAAIVGEAFAGPVDVPAVEEVPLFPQPARRKRKQTRVLGIIKFPKGLPMLAPSFLGCGRNSACNSPE